LRKLKSRTPTWGIFGSGSQKGEGEEKPRMYGEKERRGFSKGINLGGGYDPLFNKGTLPNRKKSDPYSRRNLDRTKSRKRHRWEGGGDKSFVRNKNPIVIPQIFTQEERDGREKDRSNKTGLQAVRGLKIRARYFNWFVKKETNCQGGRGGQGGPSRKEKEAF